MRLLVLSQLAQRARQLLGEHVRRGDERATTGDAKSSLVVDCSPGGSMYRILQRRSRDQGDRGLSLDGVLQRRQQSLTVRQPMNRQRLAGLAALGRRRRSC